MGTGARGSRFRKPFRVLTTSGWSSMFGDPPIRVSIEAWHSSMSWYWWLWVARWARSFALRWSSVLRRDLFGPRGARS